MEPTPTPSCSTNMSNTKSEDNASKEFVPPNYTDSDGTQVNNTFSNADDDSGDAKDNGIMSTHLSTWSKVLLSPV